MSTRATLLAEARALADAAEQAVGEGDWEAATVCSNQLRDTLETLFAANAALGGADIAALHELQARTAALAARSLEQRQRHTGDLLEFRARGRAARSYERHR